MKKRMYGGLLVLATCLWLVSLFSGCTGNPSCKALIIVNESENTIENVGISQSISKPKSDSPVSDSEVTIAAGECKTFYLAPYSTGSVSLYFYDSGKAADKFISFTYEYLVNGTNETITAVYTGTEMTVSGSKAEKVDIIT
jgi:hypothetical protein